MPSFGGTPDRIGTLFTPCSGLPAGNARCQAGMSSRQSKTRRPLHADRPSLLIDLAHALPHPMPRLVSKRGIAARGDAAGRVLTPGHLRSMSVRYAVKKKR